MRLPLSQSVVDGVLISIWSKPGRRIYSHLKEDDPRHGFRPFDNTYAQLLCQPKHD
jgi:hypothetical protein